MNLRNGWHSVCPDCSGQHSSDPNACPKRAPVAVRVCPVPSCGTRIYDNKVLGDVEATATVDPNVIKDDAYEVSTPASRTKAELDLHLWVKHARWAQTHQVAQLPAALRDVVEGMKPV